MARRKATRRTQRKARGGAEFGRPNVTVEYPGITIRFDVGAQWGTYIGPPSAGGAGSLIKFETPGGGKIGEQ